MINIKEDEKLSIINHSAAHLLAHALKRLYPQALFWVGPVIDNGFYYDVDLLDEVVTENKLVEIEKEMKKIVKSNKRIYKEEITKEAAKEMFKNDPYKLDLINKMENELVSIYKQDEFIDLCKGPHVERTGLIKHFKLLKVSGAYYKGDVKEKMLQRIYGIAFYEKEDLEDYLNFLEEAKKRDHKKLGSELGLFMISEYGPGFPFWLPKGMIIKRELENFWYEEHQKEGYIFIQTPILLNQQLWEKSGHWDNYQENMYLSEIDETKFAIKPMNCPGCLLVYKNNLHSYKELPLRIGELGLVHRHEASGALNGLFRVRNFTQDDAHIFMTEEQIEEEVISLINFIDRIYKVFNLEYKIELSTRPESKYIGSIEIWDKAEEVLKQACLNAKKTFKINEGDGAFYGPKLDFHIKDSLGRVWQCATIQLDMNLPERFDLTYIDNLGKKKRPVMIHRVIYGALERFIGILIEHYAGAFPLWLAPLQINILPVSKEHHLEHAKKIKTLLDNHNFKTELDDRDEKLSYKIRDSQIQKIPYTIILGDREQENDIVSFRKYGREDTVSIDTFKFIQLLKEEIEYKQ
ncbi:MAG: threonine--tRNA ligase [Bacilli bacterium]|jgi:threonyl-tRNA synthetase